VGPGESNPNLRIKSLLLAFALATTSTAMAAITDDVRCREVDFRRDAEARDDDRFRSFLDADTRFVGDGILRGPDAVVAGWRPFLEEGGPNIKWRPRFVEVLGDGKLALSRGPYRMVIAGEGSERVERWGTFNSVWRLHDDAEWRVVFDAGSPESEPPSETDRALLEQETGCPD
jgi:ketosteroid isomerase-like protein